MKRKDLLKLFSKNGWIVAREGGDHTILEKDNKIEAVLRHKEINERLAKALIRKHNLK